MLCVRHCVSRMRNSGKQNQTGHLLSWGAMRMAEKKLVIAIMCVGAGSGFLHLHFASGLTCQLQQFINLKAWLSKPHGFGALDQDTEERAECPALMKHCPADSAPSAKERKAGSALFPKLSEGVGFLLWSLMRSFWDLLIAKCCDIKYGRESHLQLKVTSRSPQPASRNLHGWVLALWT